MRSSSTVTAYENAVNPALKVRWFNKASSEAMASGNTFRADYVVRWGNSHESSRSLIDSEQVRLLPALLFLLRRKVYYNYERSD